MHRGEHDDVLRLDRSGRGAEDLHGLDGIRLLSAAGRDDDRALRAALLAIEELRGDVHALAARVLALAEQLAALAPDAAAVAAAVEARTAALLPSITAADASAPGRVQLGDEADKYALADRDGPPCLELLPVCEARCCELEFALSSQDLDEGIVRWDHGQPYLIRHDDRGRCVHLGADGCDCYAHRPAPCRQFDCRDDPRIWRDYAAREPAPRAALRGSEAPDPDAAATRSRGLFFEALRLRRR